MNGIIKGIVQMFMFTILITSLGSHAMGDEPKRPGEVAGCDVNLINRLLTVMETEILPLK